MLLHAKKKHCDDKEYKCSQQWPKGYSRLFPFASHILLFVGLGTSGWRRLGNGSDAHNLLNLTDHINATCFDLCQHGHILLTYIVREDFKRHFFWKQANQMNEQICIVLCHCSSRLYHNRLHTHAPPMLYASVIDSLRAASSVTTL